MKLPFGYSNSKAPSRVKPSARHSAFDGALSTDGNACRWRWRASAAARAIARAGARGRGGWAGRGGAPLVARRRGRLAVPAPREGGRHGPADLEDLPAAPLALPEADRSHRLAVLDDLEHLAVGLGV